MTRFAQATIEAPPLERTRALRTLAPPEERVASDPPKLDGDGRSERARFVLGGLAALGAIAALAQATDIWVAGLLQLVLLLVVPGLLALRALRVPGDAITGFPIYVPCASIVVLLFAGLATNLAGDGLLGIEQPLRGVPLLAGLEATCLVLLALGSFTGPETRIPWRALLASARLGVAWPLLLPVCAGAGALLLNNGHGRGLAVATMIAVALAIGLGVALAPRMTRAQLAFLLFGAALAAVWSFSLRGPFVYGFDISTEAKIAADTYRDGVWHTTHTDDAYGAMLSLTVLPSLLQALTGASHLVLLKAVYPALLACLPVALFLLGGRSALSRRIAFVAAAFVLVQAFYFQQLPAIARQEIALLLFVAIVAAIIDSRMTLRRSAPLIGVLALGVVVSHYSTTYFAVAMCAIAAIVGLVLSRWRPVPLRGAPVAVACAVLAIGAAIWYVPVTDSASNVSEFATGFQKNGFNLLPGAKPGDNVIDSYIKGNVVKRVDAERFHSLIASDYRENRTWVKPLKVASEPRYRLRDASSADPPVRAASVRNAVSIAQLAFAQLANLAAVLLALALALRRRTHPRLRQIAILGAATFAAIGFLRLSGTAANAYNQERAFVQMMIPVSFCIAWGLGWLAYRARHRARLVWGATALALMTIFVATSGLLGVATGGSTPTNLAQSGEDYDRFYTTNRELAGARWLGLAPSGTVFYADRYGVLRISGATGRTTGVLRDVTPKTINRHAWVYATSANLDGRARAEFDGRSARYRWPAGFLNSYFDTIYTNGGAEVYRR